MKMVFVQKNPINWKNDKYVICKMPLKIEPTSFKMPDDEMSYGDLSIRFEHKFIRNIFTNLTNLQKKALQMIQSMN